jgi:ABC-type spermidine/putrescine transport system permease subunit I
VKSDGPTLRYSVAYSLRCGSERRLRLFRWTMPLSADPVLRTLSLTVLLAQAGIAPVPARR